jgi:hypothetical protein
MMNLPAFITKLTIATKALNISTYSIKAHFKQNLIHLHLHQPGPKPSLS